jgi:hypothetical protein
MHTVAALPTYKKATNPKNGDGVMNKKTILCLTVLCLVVSVILIPFSSTFAEEGTVEIAGFSAVKESDAGLSSYLTKIEWKKLPVNTSNRGLIGQFVAAGDKCAIGTDNLGTYYYIYLYNGNECVACYQINVSGELRLFCFQEDFYFYDVRGDCFVCFNESSGATGLFKLTKEARRDPSLGWLGDFTSKTVNPDDEYPLTYSYKPLSIKKGDYVLTNRDPAVKPFISGRYDTLIWESGSEEEVLYSSSMRKIQIVILSVLFCVMTVVGIIMIIHGVKAKRRSKTT